MVVSVLFRCDRGLSSGTDGRAVTSVITIHLFHHRHDTSMKSSCCGDLGFSIDKIR